jgi:hypothetical protein
MLLKKRSAYIECPRFNTRLGRYSLDRIDGTTIHQTVDLEQQKMVGARGFEPPTPSPPDGGGHWKSLHNFANDYRFGLPAVNGLGPALQTV